MLYRGGWGGWYGGRYWGGGWGYGPSDPWGHFDRWDSWVGGSQLQQQGAATDPAAAAAGGAVTAVFDPNAAQAQPREMPADAAQAAAAISNAPAGAEVQTGEPVNAVAAAEPAAAAAAAAVPPPAEGANAPVVAEPAEPAVVGAAAAADGQPTP
jgi:hypothetical protein